MTDKLDAVNNKKKKKNFDISNVTELIHVGGHNYSSHWATKQTACIGLS